MTTRFDTSLIEKYKSPSQKIRIMSEDRVWRHIYCVNCWAPKIDTQPNNNKAWDFICPTCRREYELKSKKDSLGKKINDWAYHTMIEKIKTNEQPNFFFLNYSKDFEVKNLLLIPKHFFTESIVEERKPLSSTAKRANRIGCNILFGKLPEYGKIYLVKNGTFTDKTQTQELRKKWLFLNEEKNQKNKWWILDTMNCIDKISGNTFSLDQVYKFEGILKLKYPKNNHIQEKLRQQLQILRKKGIIEFVWRGQYRKI